MNFAIKGGLITICSAKDVKSRILCKGNTNCLPRCLWYREGLCACTNPDINWQQEEAHNVTMTTEQIAVS